MRLGIQVKEAISLTIQEVFVHHVCSASGKVKFMVKKSLHQKINFIMFGRSKQVKSRVSATKAVYFHFVKTKKKKVYLIKDK